MRIPPLAVLALLLTLAPAHAQPPPAPAPPPGQPGPGAPPVPNDPQAVAAQFLTFARGLLTGEHGPHEQALAPLLANLPPADPAREEVQVARGPQSAIYGSYALSSVVSFETPS